jgi:hypothetical protein
MKKLNRILTLIAIAGFITFTNPAVAQTDNQSSTTNSTNGTTTDRDGDDYGKYGLVGLLGLLV